MSYSQKSTRTICASGQNLDQETITRILGDEDKDAEDTTTEKPQQYLLDQMVDLWQFGYNATEAFAQKDLSLKSLHSLFLDFVHYGKQNSAFRKERETVKRAVAVIIPIFSRPLRQLRNYYWGFFSVCLKLSCTQSRGT